jgi:hypothetical protein
MRRSGEQHGRGRSVFTDNLITFFNVTSSGMNIQTHVVEEEPSHPTHERAVDGRRSATEESEGVVAEVRHRGVGVVEIRKHDDPVVREGVGD